MGKAKLSTPLIFQSKLLCLSLLYLFSTLLLALYSSLHPTKCLFRYSPFDPVQVPLFSYPPTYGEHKYAISTHRNHCSSPVFISGITIDLSLSVSSYLGVELWVQLVPFWILIHGFFFFRLLDCIGGDQKFMSEFICIFSGLEVYGRKQRQFWWEFQYPEEDVLF